MTIKRKLVMCSSELKRNAVRREVIGGAEHIIVSSYTLPDDIVMNGGLYPSDEIEKSYKTLERTLAPIEHPKDADGNFISASDPYAIHNYHAGAFNVNVKREGNRVHIEKHINVAEAMKTDRGKRLLDRINEIETNEKPRPIHTSTGVWLEVEELEEMKTNSAGLEYGWIARNMVFDHDAILLDNVGAAQPSQGVGIAVNQDGDSVEVETATVEDKTPRTVDKPVSMNTVTEQLRKNLNDIVGSEWIAIVDLVGDQCIFETNDGFFTVPYSADGEEAKIVGVPIRVDRKVTYTPKVNKEEGDAMKELMLKALADAGITVNSEISDSDLLAKYTELQANTSKGDDDGAESDDIATIVADNVKDAIKPLQEEVTSLKAKINADAAKEVEDLAKIVANSEQYPALDEETCKALPVEKLREMAANCNKSFGLPLTSCQFSGNESGFQATEMPE